LTTTRTGSRQLETVFDRGRLHTSAGAIGSVRAAATYAGPALGRARFGGDYGGVRNRSQKLRGLDSEDPHRSDRV